MDSLTCESPGECDIPTGVILNYEFVRLFVVIFFVKKRWQIR